MNVIIIDIGDGLSGRHIAHIAAHISEHLHATVEVIPVDPYPEHTKQSRAFNEIGQILEDCIARSIELGKVLEMEAFTDYDRRDPSIFGWHNPKVIGRPLDKHKFKDVHRTRSRTHSQVKYAWRKLKPKKYRV